MNYHVTKAEILTSKKDGKQYQKVSGVFSDGTVMEGLLPLDQAHPALVCDISPEELATYSAHVVNYSRNYNGQARLESVSPADSE